MNGLPINNKWCAAFGVYDIPQSIAWLANKANGLVGLPPLGYFDTNNPMAFKTLISSPAYKVVEEWGKWRDGQEAEKWQSTTTR